MIEVNEAVALLEARAELTLRQAKKAGKQGPSAADYDDPWASRRDDMDDG